MIKSIKTIMRQDREPYRIPRRVQDVIPIQCVWPDGIFKVGITSCTLRGMRYGSRSCRMMVLMLLIMALVFLLFRSEERRVGKECGS